MANVLPAEILAHIIEEAWAFPLTLVECLRMATSSLLITFWSIDSSFSPLKFCWSISFVLKVNICHLHLKAHPAWSDIQDLMPVLQNIFPNVSQTSVNYHNWWYNHAELVWLQFMEQITELDIVYTHSMVLTQEHLEKKTMLDVIPPQAFLGVKKLTSH
ncbi:uncharacterized protein BT62DRAFT_919048 [Guyanagaster necrorhizus]|uniref:Uncharacterized protein n=1 Tax=Guyanagaster necrorhizus TaxID=856835 RepID=A0A9P7VVT4_9AGAR|nr:uncharacterized protein BT62DRAFT_919048 [Guyanagaster necrorhizus MCA 3950]KAG7447864.1 hypothetical protein BT62DRAFT_919048 [Guyanagaster necrorhizus MCA 3950]